MIKLAKWPSAPARVRFAKASLRTCVSLGAILTAGMLLGTPTQAKSDLRVETNEGPVKGFLKNGVAEFLGIPYAAPPVGGLRWQPPQEHAPWTTVLQAKQFGN